MSKETLHRYFPDFSETLIDQLLWLEPHYRKWNALINVISRKDIDEFFVRHLLHSLALVPHIKNKRWKKVVDIGTGGGFPGLPMALVFPEIEFHLVDSVGKKLKIIDDAKDQLQIKNIITHHKRIEDVQETFDAALSRAVAPMSDLWKWMKKHWNGKEEFWLLKGGELREEFLQCKTAFNSAAMEEFPISQQFSEPFFETKKVIHLHRK